MSGKEDAMSENGKDQKELEEGKLEGGWVQRARVSTTLGDRTSQHFIHTSFLVWDRLRVKLQPI